MANNNYKKEYTMDHFGMKYYCQHAQLNLKRSEKHFSTRKIRRAYNKKV